MFPIMVSVSQSFHIGLRCSFLSIRFPRYYQGWYQNKMLPMICGINFFLDKKFKSTKHTVRH